MEIDNCKICGYSEYIKDDKCTCNKEYLVVKKGKKYLEGWSYASPSHIQYSFYWTTDIKKARGFNINHPDSDHFASLTNGKVKIVRNL